MYIASLHSAIYVNPFYLVVLDRMNCGHQNKTELNFPFLSYCQVVYMYIANDNTEISYKKNYSRNKL